MKRRDEVDPDDGSRVLGISWGDGKSFRAMFDVDDQGNEDATVFMSATVRDVHITIGTIDADDAKAMALFWADISAALSQEQQR